MPIDCDLHPPTPRLADLLPHMDAHWRETLVSRGVDELISNYEPPGAPISARPGVARDVAGFLAAALDPLGTTAAILNPLLPVAMLHSEDMAAAYARAANDWIAARWLDADPRLRASILVAPQSPALAADEILRCAEDRRFVQVLLPALLDVPLGRRSLWPIYAAAERAGLPVGVHAGSAYLHAPGPISWGSYVVEDHANMAGGFATQLTSLVAEGVFQRFPDLTVVLLESGVTWLPAHLWRLSKFWRGLRMEVPWLDESPQALVRRRLKVSLAPMDAPDVATFLHVIEQLDGAEMLLFSSDYPHWNDDRAPVPEGLPAELLRKMREENPRATYRRLAEVPA